ncbi:MAG: hypothetical protein ABGZ35_27835 [Planctomycetaceae bacterium]
MAASEHTFQPAKKQLHLPQVKVSDGDQFRRKVERVGGQNPLFAGFLVLSDDDAKRTFEQRVVLNANHEAAAGLVEFAKHRVVRIAAIGHIKAARLDHLSQLVAFRRVSDYDGGIPRHAF